MYLIPAIAMQLMYEIYYQLYQLKVLNILVLSSHNKTD